MPVGPAKCSQTQYRAVTFDQHDRDGSGFSFLFFFFLVCGLSSNGTLWKVISIHFAFARRLRRVSETSQEHLKQAQRTGPFVVKNLDERMLKKN